MSKSSNYQQDVFSRMKERKDIVDIRIKKMRKDLQATINGTSQPEEGKLKLLDVGCGSGHVISPYKNECDLYGVEICEASAELAREAGLNVSVVDLEDESLPFDDNSYDIVMSGEVIEHIINTDNYLFEINRVLKPGGHFIMSFPNINQPVSWAAQILLDVTPKYAARYKSPHIRDFTLRIVKRLLDHYGFKIVKVKGSYVSPFQNKLSIVMADIFPRFGDQIIITSVKTNDNVQKDERNIVWDTRDI